MRSMLILYLSYRRTRLKGVIQNARIRKERIKPRLALKLQILGMVSQIGDKKKVKVAPIWKM